MPPRRRPRQLATIGSSQTSSETLYKLAEVSRVSIDRRSPDLNNTRWKRLLLNEGLVLADEIRGATKARTPSRYKGTQPWILVALFVKRLIQGVRFKGPIFLASARGGALLIPAGA